MWLVGIAPHGSCADRGVCLTHTQTHSLSVSRDRHKEIRVLVPTLTCRLCPKLFATSVPVTETQRDSRSGPVLVPQTFRDQGTAVTGSVTGRMYAARAIRALLYPLSFACVFAEVIYSGAATLNCPYVCPRRGYAKVLHKMPTLFSRFRACAPSRWSGRSHPAPASAPRRSGARRSSARARRAAACSCHPSLGGHAVGKRLSGKWCGREPSAFVASGRQQGRGPLRGPMRAALCSEAQWGPEGRRAQAPRAQGASGGRCRRCQGDEFLERAAGARSDEHRVPRDRLLE